jgi:hypothetical protein
MKGNVTNNTFENAEVNGDCGIVMIDGPRDNTFKGLRVNKSDFNIDDFKAKLAHDAGDSAKIREDVAWARKSQEAIWRALPENERNQRQTDFDTLERSLLDAASDKETVLKLVQRIRR